MQEFLTVALVVVVLAGIVYFVKNRKKAPRGDGDGRGDGPGTSLPR